MRAGLAALLGILVAGAVAAQDLSLTTLSSADETRGWEAVGRIDIGPGAFCTGTLISPSLVLTAAHCLFDQVSGRPHAPADFEFLAGWRNGRALAYRGVKRTVAHPDYVFEGRNRMDRVAYDLAFLELDQPIRLPSVHPFEIGQDPMRGDQVGVVSYALDRADAPSLQRACEVLGRQPGVLVLTCSVDFGSSGAPIFTLRDGVPSIVSVVSAKAEMDSRPVALGTEMTLPLAELRAAYEREAQTVQTVAPAGSRGVFGATGNTTAKFVKP